MHSVLEEWVDELVPALKNVKNEKCTLKDLEIAEKTENHGK